MKIYTFMVVSPHLHGESSYLGYFGIFFRVFYAQSLLVGGFNQFFQGSDPPLAKKTAVVARSGSALIRWC